jgi:hypothetical protein
LSGLHHRPQALPLYEKELANIGLVTVKLVDDDMIVVGPFAECVPRLDYGRADAKSCVGIQARLSGGNSIGIVELTLKGWGAFPDKGASTLKRSIMIGLVAAAAIVTASSTLSAQYYGRQYGSYGRQHGGYGGPRGHMGRPFGEFGRGGEFRRSRGGFGQFGWGRRELGRTPGEFGRFGRGREWKREGEPD